MATVSTLPNVDLAVLPLNGRQLGTVPLNYFVIYDRRLLVIEISSGTVVHRDPKDIAYHETLFDHFHDHALRGEEATVWLSTVAGQFMREQA